MIKRVTKIEALPTLSKRTRKWYQFNKKTNDTMYFFKNTLFFIFYML